jgi:hypothetical protein
VRRYAGDEARQIVVVAALQAPRRRRFGGRRARRADPSATPVEVTRATVVEADPLADEEAAAGWLRRAAGDEATVDGALAVLNRTLHFHRLATADPFASELRASSALVTRVGYGTGPEVAEGRWTAARELPRQPPAVAREHALRPQERLAALLAGRDATLACELPALRARLDLSQGRTREAALQLEAALVAALEELRGWRELPTMPARLDELGSHASPVAAAAAAARSGVLDEAGVAAVGVALTRLEAALRARTAGAPF